MVMGLCIGLSLTMRRGRGAGWREGGKVGTEWGGEWRGRYVGSWVPVELSHGHLGRLRKGEISGCRYIHTVLMLQWNLA